MKNDSKLGRAILDKEIKLVKKLTKNMTIKPLQNDGYYMDSDLNNSVIKIKSIRKYRNRCTVWSNNKEQYVYEIDVIVDMKSQGWYGSNRYCQRYARRYNNYYRGSILGALIQELKYFGIDNHNMNVTISKIDYKEI
jgi:hypothetical protein